MEATARARATGRVCDAYAAPVWVDCGCFWITHDCGFYTDYRGLLGCPYCNDTVDLVEAGGFLLWCASV